MRRFALLLAGALLLTVFVPGVAAAKAPTASPVTVPVTGTLQNGLGSVTGTFALDHIAKTADGLVAVGTFTGAVTDAVGATTTGTQDLALPVAVTGTCAILHLTLGPLDLNLLGLQVHLNQVVLNIDAQAAPGNLLGNLLCAVAHLLDGTGPLGGLAALLNRILAILAGLSL
jgi:hypothetical protein